MKLNKTDAMDVILHVVFILAVIISLYPILLVLGVSLSSEKSIVEYGYKMIPKQISSDAYKYIWQSKNTILRAYGVTIFTTVFGTVCSVMAVALYAYPLSRKDFKYRKFFSFLALFTMLFHAGMVPWYIVCTQVLHIQNTIWAMILPYIMNAWYVLIMRTFFITAIPAALIESAKLEGASEGIIFAKIVMPLSLPGLATIGLFAVLQYWNDWWLPLMLTTRRELSNLQFLLQSMISNIEMLTQNSEYVSSSISQLANMPKEGARMALCVISIGPLVLAYPFFQKYFVSGLTVGAVKE